MFGTGGKAMVGGGRGIPFFPILTCTLGGAGGLG